jgi:hypothetical protein
MTKMIAETVLAVAPEGMAEFIQQQATTRSLSKMIKALNRDLTDGDARLRDQAAAALRHLGFCDQPDCC